MSRSNPVGPFRYGQIVLANVSDGHGHTKTRPVVIVTPTADIIRDEPILAVCISTQIKRPMPAEHVPIPWSNPRHPRTGVNKPNVAKCNWVVSVLSEDIIEVRGIVPAKPMGQIDAVLKRLESDEAGSA